MADKDKEKDKILKKGDKPLKNEDLDKVVGGMPKQGGGRGTVSDTGSEVDDS